MASAFVEVSVCERGGSTDSCFWWLLWMVLLLFGAFAFACVLLLLVIRSWLLFMSRGNKGPY